MSSFLINSPGTFRPMLRLVLPVLVEHLLHLLVDYTDMFLTGRFLGETSYVAAITIVGYCTWFLFNIFVFVALGATVMTARFTGAGDTDGANRVANQAITVGLVWAIVLSIVGQLALPQFISAIQLEGEAAAAAVSYLRIVLLILPALMLEEVGIACFRGAGHMITGLVVMSTVNVINIVVGCGLLLGIGPLPKLGWEGLAIGTAGGHAVGGLLVLILLLRGHAGYRLRLAQMRPDRDLIRRLLRVGLPGGVDQLSMIGAQFWFLSIINQLGIVATAAHGVAVRIEALAYMPGAAFQVAAATIAGQYLGAQDPRRATRSLLMACAVGGGFMTTVGVAFFFASHNLVQIFLGTGAMEIIPIAANLMRIVALSMPGLAISMILAGGLRGAGDTRITLAITFAGLVGVRIPLAYLLAHQGFHVFGTSYAIAGYGLGVAGAWYAMVIDIYVRCTLIAARFFHGGWKRIQV